MITGSNDVYTPVDAYGVTTFADGISSGGTGGDATLTQGVRFMWVYDPDNPSGAPSGFTGQGWFEGTNGSPIWYSTNLYNITLADILKGFADGDRTDLNDVFKNWQNYVDAAASQGNDIVQNFQQLVGYSCWSNLNGGQG